MDGLLNLKEIPRKNFRRHFLTSVHSEIRFEGNQLAVVLQNKDTLFARLQSQGFTVCNETLQGEFSIQNDPNSPPVVRHSSTVTGLSFSSVSPRREFQVLGDKIVISDFAYDGFENFIRRMRDFASTVTEVLHWNRTIIQVGLRKINNVRIEPATSLRVACATFNPALFAVSNAGLCPEDALSFCQNVVTIERGSHAAIVQASVRKQENAPAFEAVLDFDLIDRGRFSLAEIFSDKLVKINETHFTLFMWAATDRLIAAMESP